MSQATLQQRLPSYLTRFDFWMSQLHSSEHRWSRSGLFFALPTDLSPASSGTEECSGHYKRLENRYCCCGCRANYSCDRQNGNSSDCCSRSRRVCRLNPDCKILPNLVFGLKPEWNLYRRRFWRRGENPAIEDLSAQLMGIAMQQMGFPAL